MPEQADRVAVLLDRSNDTLDGEAEAMHALACITGDWFKAYGLISGRDETSSFPGKGVIAAPVTRDAAEVIIKWLASVGAHAFVGDYYEDEEGES